jgi:hypothetical protein
MTADELAIASEDVEAGAIAGRTPNFEQIRMPRTPRNPRHA